MDSFDKYVTTADLQAGWRALDYGEEELAETLLERAEARVQLLLDTQPADMDARMLTVYKTVICDMVRLAMPPTVYQDETESWENSATGGWLRLTDDQAAALGISSSVRSIRANTDPTCGGCWR